MSRMLGYVGSDPATAREVLGALLDEFWALSRLHSDGWGTAWIRRGHPRSGGEAESTASPPAGAIKPASARMLYLRFASSGSPAREGNVQPFLRGKAAFQHNGLIAPRELLADLLTSGEKARLRGDTDSEMYFTLVRRYTRTSSQGPAVLDGLARAVDLLRASAPDACLNAFILRKEGLYVVHSAARRPAPAAAFAARGWTAEMLPPGHDGGYNRLSLKRTGNGQTVVASTGIDQSGWEEIPEDTVSLITPGGAVLTESL